MLTFHNDRNTITVIRNSITDFSNKFEVCEMATRLISPEDVSNACSDLVKAGEEPSTLRVHKMLGKGSYNTIQKFIAQWRESDEAKEAKTAQLPAVVSLPPEFEEGAMQFVKQIFKLAQDESAAKVIQVQTERDQAIAKANNEAKEAIDFAEERGSDVEQLQEGARVLSEKIASLEEEIGRQKASNEELSRLNAVANEELKSALEQTEGLADLTHKLETEKALLDQECNAAKDALVKTQKKHDIAFTDLKAEHAKATDTLTESHNKAVEDLVKANNKTVSTLEKAVADAQKQRNEEREVNNRLTKEEVKALARINELEAELSAFKKQMAEKQMAEKQMEDKS